MKVKAVKVNRAHYFLTDPRTCGQGILKDLIAVKPRLSKTIRSRRLFEKRLVRNLKFGITVTFTSW